MADKRDAFKGGDYIHDPHPPHQSTSSNDDSEDRSTDGMCQSPPESNRSPLSRYSESSSSPKESGLLIDLSPENSSNSSTSNVLADASESSAQSLEGSFPDVSLDVVCNDGYPFEANIPEPSRPTLEVFVPVPSISPVKADASGPALEVVIPIPSNPSASLNAAGTERSTLEAVASVPSISPVKADAPGTTMNVIVPFPLIPVFVREDAPGPSRIPSEPDLSRPPSDTRFGVQLNSLPSRFVLALVSPKYITVDHSSIPTDKHIQQDLIGSEGYSATFEGTKRCCNHKTDSSSESDCCAESRSVWKGLSVHNKKRSRNDACLSMNVSSEAKSPRRDPLAIEPIQSFLTPPSRQERIGLSKSSPRKRLQSTQLDRPKSTSPGTSYWKLSRSSSVGNVHLNVPNLEVSPPERDACSLNQATLSTEISGSPCHAEPVSLPSSLALPNLSSGSLRVSRCLSSEAQSTCCDPNPLTPVAHFTTSNNPRLRGYDQHALPAHLHQTRKTTSPFGSRILNPPVQPSCQLPRLRVFPERSPMLNTSNRVLKNIRIRPPQADTQISKQLADKTKRRACTGDSLTARYCFDDQLEIIKETLPSSTRDCLVHSETPRDSLISSEAPLDGPGTSQVFHDSAPEMPIFSTLARSSRSHHQQSSGSAALELLATTAATQQRLQSSSIHELSLPSTSHGAAEGISPLLPSTSNSEGGASFPFIPVGPGEASTSSYRPSVSTLSIYQRSLSDLLQTTALSEGEAGVVAHLPFRGSSHFAEAKRLLYGVCRSIARNKAEARWMECYWTLPSTSSLSASSETELSKLPELLTENKTGPFLGINASSRSDLIDKECYAMGLREAILALSSNALATALPLHSNDLKVMLTYYNAFIILSQVFRPFKADAIRAMNSADRSFRQRMPKLLDQISSYLGRLQLALENLLRHICGKME